MAYVSQTDKKELSVGIKKVLKKYGMKGKNYYNNDNAMIDYFDRSHYTDINIGKWNKPYKLDIENMGSSFLPKVA